VLFFYSPDRKGERPIAHLNDFAGVLHADGYAGFNGLYESGPHCRSRLLGGSAAEVF
jgi:transposase